MLFRSAVCWKPGKDGACEEIALGITGVTDKPFRAMNVEAALKGKMLEPKTLETAVAGVVEGMDVNGNIHASAEFRAHLARVYVSRAIQAAN